MINLLGWSFEAGFLRLLLLRTNRVCADKGIYLTTIHMVRAAMEIRSGLLDLHSPERHSILKSRGINSPDNEGLSQAVRHATICQDMYDKVEIEGVPSDGSPKDISKGLAYTYVNKSTRK